MKRTTYGIGNRNSTEAESEEENDGNGNSFEETEEEDESGNEDERYTEADEYEVIAPSFFETIEKVRKIVKSFKSSPVQNSILQKHGRRVLNKDLGLFLDVRTRWNSMLLMMERFILLRDPIELSLTDLKLKNMIIDEVGIDKINSVIVVLSPIEIAVKTLSNRDKNLLAAEGVLHFLLKHLSSQNIMICQTKC